MIIGKAISPLTLKKKSNGGGGGIDADAQAFITTTGISGTNATATNQLVLDLKAANIWTKMQVIYPFVGGTSAFTHKFNLKDPRDLNAAFRLVFSGGGTFSANGYLPNGVNAFADTFFAPNIYTNGTSHYSFYSRTNVAASAVVFGSNSVGPNYYYTTLNPRNLSNQCTNAINENTGEVFPNSSSLGLFTLNRQNANDYDVWVNSTKQINTTKLALGRTSFKIYLGALNAAGTASNFSTNECAFFTAGLPLTDAEALAFYNIVQTFQTTLGRQV